MNARNFFTELTRRRVYSVAAWLIRRLALRLSPNFGMLKLKPLWEPLRWRSALREIRRREGAERREALTIH